MRDENRPIRETVTNSGPDSKGIVSIAGWELEGATAFYIVAGALCSVTLIFATSALPFMLRFMICALPLGLTAGWVQMFVHGKPPGYQGDLFRTFFKGRSFGLSPQKWSQWRHPRSVVLAGMIAKEARRG